MSYCYVMDVYKTLIESYQDWILLSAYLESEEGGSFRISDQDDVKGTCIIRYEKGVSRSDLPHSRWFRSLVWDMRANRPLAVSPPKPTSTAFPKYTMKEALQAEIFAEEFVDGFMINGFKRGNGAQVMFASRSKLNATGRFYSTKTFRELFRDAYIQSSLYTAYETDHESIFQNALQDWESPVEEKGEITVFYSFVVQHRENRIVTPIALNRAILLHKGVVFSDGSIRFQEGFPVFRGESNLPNLLEAVEETMSESVLSCIAAQNDRRGWDFQGIVLKDGFGNRWRFASEKYKCIKSLRGNHSGHVERFSELYTQNLVTTYLQYYPEDGFQFSFHSYYVDTLIQTTYGYYVALHITWTLTLTDIDRMYQPHLYALHGIYLSKKRPLHEKISLADVHIYYSIQPWQRIAFMLRKVEDIYFTQLQQALYGESSL